MKYKTEKVRISSDGEEMKMLILIPSDPVWGSNRPGVLWIHGGGYITGMSRMVYMSRAKNLVKKYGAVVISDGLPLSPQEATAIVDANIAVSRIAEIQVL